VASNTKRISRCEPSLGQTRPARARRQRRRGHRARGGPRQAAPRPGKKCLHPNSVAVMACLASAAAADSRPVSTWSWPGTIALPGLSAPRRSWRPGHRRDSPVRCGKGKESLSTRWRQTAGGTTETDDAHGVVELTLHPAEYAWKFVAASPTTFSDAGSGSRR